VLSLDVVSAALDCCGLDLAAIDLASLDLAALDLAALDLAGSSRLSAIDREAAIACLNGQDAAAVEAVLGHWRSEKV